jgi:hypothetical protein
VRLAGVLTVLHSCGQAGPYDAAPSPGRSRPPAGNHQLAQIVSRGVPTAFGRNLSHVLPIRLTQPATGCCSRWRPEVTCIGSTRFPTRTRWVPAALRYRSQLSRLFCYVPRPDGYRSLLGLTTQHERTTYEMMYRAESTGYARATLSATSSRKAWRSTTPTPLVRHSRHRH